MGPSGGAVIVPDLFVNDGKTMVVLAPDALTAPVTLCIGQASASVLPPGPAGTTPAAVYTITLTGGAALSGEALLVLSYPSDANGKILNDPLAMKMWDREYENGWAPHL